MGLADLWWTYNTLGEKLHTADVGVGGQGAAILEKSAVKKPKIGQFRDGRTLGFKKIYHNIRISR